MQVDGALTVMHRATMPLSLAFALAAASTACIEEQRRLATDTTETSAPDDTSAPDTSAPDVSPPDTGVGDGVEPDAPAGDTTTDGTDAPDWETATSDCTSDGDCADRTARECQQWVCTGGWCTETATTGGPCDDGDQCTVDDFCDQGVCAAGWVLTCDMLSPDCWAATGETCGPDTGCPGVAAPVGMGCYDGYGLEGGTCYNGWVVPDDRCDGEGLCLDTSGLVPTTIHPLAGTWSAILTRGQDGVAMHVLTADLTLGTTGGLTAANIRSTNLLWAQTFGIDAPPPQGQFCASLDGQLDLAVGTTSLQGVANPDSSFIVLHGSDNTMGLALRSTGNREAVSGVYHVVVLEGSDETPSSYLTRVGQLSFEAGCISEPGFLEPTVGQGARLTIAASPQDCFELSSGHWSLAFTLTTEAGAAIPQNWTGAIGGDGDMLLLARDEARLKVGTILLVRVREQVPVADLEGTWYFASRRGGLGANASTPSAPAFEAGLLVLGDSTSDLYGRLIGETGSGYLGQWWFPGAAGRYSQRAAIDELVVHHTGVIAPRTDVIVAWVAQDPEGDAAEPQTLRLPPKEGSLFVGVRWRPFVDQGL